MKNLLRSTLADIPASVVVFLVALPLCLGVAVASDASIITGVIAGIVGGTVVGFISKSHLSVSGPAAGLTAIVASAIGILPSYEFFLIAVILSGIMQVILGFAKAGVIGEFIPNSVIKGMLSAIGIILILKQIPHFLGIDSDPEGDESFIQIDHKNTYSEIIDAIQNPNYGSVIIGLVAVAILLIYETKWVKLQSWVKFLPGPLLVVIAGIGLNSYLGANYSELHLSGDHLVNIPLHNSVSELFGSLPKPDLSGIYDFNVWTIAITLAIVASLESLLSIEAIDKLDPFKRITPTNHELKAQGIGNIVSGILGGLPVTSVIVRSSANVYAGAQSKLSTITHGLLLLTSLLVFPKLLNLIPLSALAGILIITGYKLAKISIFKEMYKKGKEQFLPFIVTIVAIINTDLLKGILVGILFGLYYVVRSNFKSSVFVMKDEFRYLIRFSKEVSFLNKPYLKSSLEKIPENTAVLIDATKSEFIDQDIVEMINDYIINAQIRNIRVYIKQSQGNNKQFFDDITQNVIQ